MSLNLLLSRRSLALLCLLLPLSAFAQFTKSALTARPDISKVEMSPERGTPYVIELVPEKTAATDAAALVTGYFDLQKGADEIRADRATTNKEGITFQLFRRFHQGVQVEHDRYNLLSGPQGPQAITAEHHKILEPLNVRPTLSIDEALLSAKNYVGAEQYAWEQVEEDYLRHVWAPPIMEQISAELEEVRPGGELTIVDNYSTDNYDPDLAWKFNLYASKPLSRAWVYVNAHTGEIMLYDRIIKHASQPTTVTTRYAGDRSIMIDLESSGLDPNSGLPLTDSRSAGGGLLLASGPMYVLRDDTRGDGLETYDMNGLGGAPISLAALYTQSKAFTDDDTNWTLAEHKRGGTVNEAENDDVAWDAHWGTQMVYDYWLDVHGRASYDDNDIAIKSFLHYGVAYDNAFWNGTAMTYGDGSSQGGTQAGFAPLMSLDVCGHEIGHAICTFTADLVYASESGAMNEGFSDIWGAAIEAYVFREVDATLANRMAPYGIGEQIDERDNGIQYPDAGWQALRYMDDPNKAGDPDTYGGANWQNPDCEPSLANDQCGVHTNSGVLNKWYYILTNGESATNDKGDAYSVVGVDFEVSEKIAYGTELMLTPNATFAEARAASIAYVRTLPSGEGGGACGNLEEQVTNSWYGVGVGPAFVCGVTAGFTLDESSVGELVSDNNDCDASKAFTVEAAINASGTVAVSGTATEGEDFTISNPNYTVGPSGFGSHEFIVNIIDDARIEGDETIILSIGSLTHTITLIDNDIQLSVGNGEVTLLDGSTPNEDWTTIALLEGPNDFFKTADGGTVGIDGTGGVAPVYNGNSAADDLILSTPLIDARGLRQLNVSFDWTAGGETDVPSDVQAGPNGIPVPVATPLDYGNLAYSFDGTTWTDFTEFQTFNGILLTIATGSFDEQLPDFLQGTQFYLGFRWRNDPLVGGLYSFSFTDPLITATGTGIATTTTSIEDDFKGGDEIFFLTPTGDEVIARIENTGASDFGCTTVEITTDGGGHTAMFPDGDYFSKTISVTPTTNDPSGTYAISLYFTDAEIAAYLAESDNELGDLVLFKTAGPLADAMPGDVETGENLTQTTVPGGVYFSADFSSGFSSFAFGKPASSALPTDLLSFNAQAVGKVVILDWATAREENNDGFSVERAMVGNNTFSSLGWVPAASGRSGAGSYQFTDPTAQPGQSYHYRLKQQDLDGTFTYSDIRQVTLAAGTESVSIFPNPTSNKIRVSWSGTDQLEGTTLSLIDATGKTLETQTAIEGQEMDLSGRPSGLYFIRVRKADGTTSAHRLLKQ
ncbi:T9SS type A sorting domain-containing protein [Neolewinella aurantiaca]|uniref:T9SS type A sorting domain-containing protein n=1 Tax=Neolewinella aurantiaca TaxID=2602767 RepID=A0A5C7FGM3_9BACT|nr:M4 family metallopeptidase [Neolewinella aurantiaca]TXF89514.1 T9SS type A sorting domain-containing protein [Neolewinella aurantiaca]